MSEQRKAVIKNADMSEDMQQDAVDCASQALSKYNIEKVSLACSLLLNNSSSF
jgi:dynein light chain LC8-type